MSQHGGCGSSRCTPLPASKKAPSHHTHPSSPTKLVLASRLLPELTLTTPGAGGRGNAVCSGWPSFPLKRACPIAKELRPGVTGPLTLLTVNRLLQEHALLLKHEVSLWNFDCKNIPTQYFSVPTGKNYYKQFFHKRSLL